MDNNLEDTARRFRKLVNRLRRLGPGVSLPENIAMSASHLAMLEHIASHPGCGIQEMAEVLKLSAPTVSIGVRQMESSALIARKPDPDDGRAVQLLLTQQGRKRNQQVQSFQHKKIEKLLRGLTHEERETLVGLLEQAIDTAENDT